MVNDKIIIPKEKGKRKKELNMKMKINKAGKIKNVMCLMTV